MEFYATCAMGFEALAAEELHALGCGKVRPLKGRVSFEGELTDAYRVCLYSRIASRVAQVLARVDASDADTLYEGAKALPWEELLAPTAPLLVDASGTNAELRETRFTGLRVRDAVSDALFERTGTKLVRSSEEAPVRLLVGIRENRASIARDLSGDALFRRLVEKPVPGAIRPDYAAALLGAAGWKAGSAEGALVVPFSPSDSLVMEAAAIACEIIPGALRSGWGFMRWLDFDEAAWKTVESAARGDGSSGSRIYIVDPVGIDRTSLTRSLRAAGIPDAPVEFLPAEKLARVAKGNDIRLACDLSQLRSDDLISASELRDGIERMASGLPAHTRITTLARDGAIDSLFGAEPTERLDTLIGRDAASISVFGIPEELPERIYASVRDTQVRVELETSQQFASRLAKVLKQRRKWARREDVGCYRLYDADLPDYALAIDVYEDIRTQEISCVLAEYAPPKEIEPALARTRLTDAIRITAAVLGIPSERVHVKTRTRSKGGSQYAASEETDSAATKEALIIEEGGLEFEVDLSSRLDTGIFLDNRETRALLREMAKPGEGGSTKSFLNLFAYTGTASVYAADGGASTTTVDLSQPYLAWAERNMERNGFSGPEHEFIRGDVLAWVQEARHKPRKWDLIFCEPPTFSNSSRMRSRSFDVQRDHAELLIGVSRLLSPGGTCVFSCNLRRFEPDTEKLGRAGVSIEDITARTIPEDFSRTPRIHSCYLVRRI